jgi:hypothetical protein
MSPYDLELECLSKILSGNHAAQSSTTPLLFLINTDEADILSWLSENINFECYELHQLGAYTLGRRIVLWHHVMFNDVESAMLFKLRWIGI